MNRIFRIKPTSTPADSRIRFQNILDILKILFAFEVKLETLGETL